MKPRLRGATAAESYSFDRVVAAIDLAILPLHAAEGGDPIVNSMKVFSAILGARLAERDATMGTNSLQEFERAQSWLLIEAYRLAKDGMRGTGKPN